jgi:hypothetical protein
VGCRKNSPGRPCCESDDCVFDRDDLPEEFIIDGGTILKSQWIESDVSLGSSGVQTGCCWQAQLFFPIDTSRWEFYCSSEVLIDTYATKLVAYRVLKFINVNISRTVMACDGGGSMLQYYVIIDKYYGGQYGNQYYYPPSPSCNSLVFSMAFSLLPGTRYDYHVARSKAYTSLPTGTYTMVDGDEAICTPQPRCLNFGGGLTSVTIENTSTGQSIVLDDTEDWDFDIVF